VVDLQAGAVDFMESMSLQEKPKYMTWGFQEMDEKLFAEPGDFVVIGGYPSAGKTLLSLQIAMHMAQDYRVGYFSLETSPRKLMDRIMAAQAKVPLAKIKRRDLDAQDWDAVRDVTSQLAKRSLDLVRASGMTVADIRAQVLQKRYQVIFVDYLQLVQAKGTGRYEQVTAISMGLHTLAQDLGVAVIALAQLSRPEKGSGPMKPPNMTSFRESGQIEQDADIAILLYPEDPNDNGSQRVLKVSKNKEGGKFALDLAFDGQTQRLTPVQKPHHSEVGDQMRNAGRKAKVQYRQAALDGFEEVNGPDGNLPF
jgi:replicative DNA helicase